VGDVGHDLLLAGGAGRHAGLITQHPVVAHIPVFGIVNCTAELYRREEKVGWIRL